jgi:hypothetical protein
MNKNRILSLFVLKELHDLREPFSYWFFVRIIHFSGVIDPKRFQLRREGKFLSVSRQIHHRLGEEKV